MGLALIGLSMAKADESLNSLQTRLFTPPDYQMYVNYGRVENPSAATRENIFSIFDGPLALGFHALVTADGERYSVRFREDSDPAFDQDEYWDGAQAYSCSHASHELKLWPISVRRSAFHLTFVRSSTDFSRKLFDYWWAVILKAGVVVESQRDDVHGLVVSAKPDDATRIEFSFIKFDDGGLLVDKILVSQSQGAYELMYRHCYSRVPHNAGELGEVYTGFIREERSGGNTSWDVFSIKILAWAQPPSDRDFVPEMTGIRQINDCRLGSACLYPAGRGPVSIEQLKLFVSDPTTREKYSREIKDDEAK